MSRQLGYSVIVDVLIIACFCGWSAETKPYPLELPI